MAAEDYLSDREQEEALREWWRENRSWIAAGVVLGLGLLGGWQYWKSYRATQAMQAAALYQDLRGALERQETDQATRLLADLAGAHGDSAYVQQGRLLIARSHVVEGRTEDALALLREVSETADDEELAQIAKLRTARLLIDQGKPDEALAMLNAEQAGAFAAQVREIRGDALVAKGDADAARAEYAAALAGDADAQIDRTLVELKLQDVGGELGGADQVRP